MKALETSFETGQIDKQAFETERRTLLDLESEKGRVARKLSWQDVVVFHTQTFYDFGGAIKENERYLLGIYPVPGEGGAYRLEEAYGQQNIIWGDAREYFVAAWRSPEDLTMATPFGAYNPNDDDHCAILRGLKNAQVEPTPRDLAAHLLDKHQVVAYGEFTDFPDFTGEERDRLTSKSIQVRFRIRKLHR